MGVSCDKTTNQKIRQNQQKYTVIGHTLKLLTGEVKNTDWLITMVNVKGWAIPLDRCHDILGSK